MALIIQFLDEFRIETDETTKTRYRRDFCVLILKLLQSPDLTLDELHTILISPQYNVHPQIITSFNDVLLDLATNGSGSLLDIIDSLNRIMTFNDNSIVPGIETSYFISKNSVVGMPDFAVITVNSICIQVALEIKVLVFLHSRKIDM